MTASTALAAAWVALALWAGQRLQPRRLPADRRTAILSTTGRPARRGRRGAHGSPTFAAVARWVGVGVLALVGHRQPTPVVAERTGIACLLGGAVAVVSPMGAVAAAALAWWLPPVVSGRRAARRADACDAAVPELAELMVVALRAGSSPRRALEAAASRAPLPIRGPALDAVRALRRGRPLHEAMTVLAQAGTACAQLAAAVSRAVATGGPVAATLAQIAADGRRAERQRAQAAARRLPVLLLFPLTFCILPAFGLLTVGPALARGLRVLSP